MLGIFLDIETTGLDPQKHRAIDIAFTIVNFSSYQVVAGFQSLIKPSSDMWEGRDLNSMEINGYTWEEVAQGKEPSEVGQQIIEIFTKVGIERGKAVFICQNPAFDRGFFAQLIGTYTQESLNWPYHWLDLASMYWANLVQNASRNQQTFPESLNLSKNEIAKAFQLPSEELPHKASNGVKHLLSCYCAVLGVNINIGITE